MLSTKFRKGGCQKLLGIFSAKGFWAGLFSVKGGGGYPPNSAKEKSAKKQVL